MGYRNLSSCLQALEEKGELVRVQAEIDPGLEAGMIQRRIFEAGGPAVLFENVKGTPFPMACNIFGTLERARWIFRDTLRTVERIMKAKADPFAAMRRPWEYLGAPKTLYNTLPKRVSDGPVMQHETTVSQLPNLVSWPMDGGGYVTLPQVYSEDPEKPGFPASNLGMYRVQLTGNDFEKDREVGLHYQIHRGIGAHHAKAIAKGEPLKVNVFIGGPPAMTLAAVMPLPEGIAELFFAGAMAGHRIPMVSRKSMLPILAEADFCISGWIDPKQQKPEGPFGDHLGYYSLIHDFPVLKVDKVWHREGAIWPFTTVGRPPQEDTVFGTFIHELTAELVPTVFSGVHEVHAIDAAGVHPLLLAVGSERYVPYADERQPQELLTNAMALLGNTQTSLSKYVMIAAREDSPNLSAHNVTEFFQHMLERTDFERDLHFITRTTMDTLDYSGISLNQGSKLVWAACGSKKRQLETQLPENLPLPKEFGKAKVFKPGICIIQGPKHTQPRDNHDPLLESLAQTMAQGPDLTGFPMIIVADDSAFTAANWDNFLWAVFTRSDPATDIYAPNATTHCKHWGAKGPIIIDARLKSYHAPPLETDPATEARVNQLAAPGGPLHGLY